jgi:hypothetical protein
LPNSVWAQAVPWSEVEAMHGRIGRHFARSEPRDRAVSYVLGLLAPLDRKNGRRLADFAEESRPDGMQRLLTRARWNADAVRDELQDYVSERFGHPSAVLLLAEAAFEKRGSTSAGLGSHYDQAAGRFVKSQLGLFLAYKTAGRPVVLVDRRLYGATAGESARESAGGSARESAGRSVAKANLASDMVAGTRQRLPFRWLAGGDVFGTDRGLRARLERDGVPYIFTVPSSLRCLSEKDRAVVARRMNELLTARSDPWYRPEEDKSTVELFAPEWARLPLCVQAGTCVFCCFAETGERARWPVSFAPARPTPTFPSWRRRRPPPLPSTRPSRWPGDGPVSISTRCAANRRGTGT